MSHAREGRSISRSLTPPPSRIRRRSLSPSPTRLRRSRSRSRGRSRSRSREPGEVVNPGNNLYVTGLSTRVSTSDLEKHFSTEGKIAECHLVTDPRTRESRGFAFIMMETVEDADRCIKYLNRSVLEGRLITVEKAKRKRGRTPTPGRYQGVKDKRGGFGGDRGDHGPIGGRRRSRSYSPRGRPSRDVRDFRDVRDEPPYFRNHRERSPPRYPPHPYSRPRSPYGRRGDDYPAYERRR
ncbi:hypothetical protein MKW92_010059 [Papaver armeniacum]|nr:hypothetical protein MKW92_003714 [Papaver armeniacum]KAI3942028.1 hypothetical protein MKW92_010059 [Papaver armeniacum]